MLKNESVEAISSPEFINLEPCTDMVSRCQIKVLYVGKNRNGSFITKEVATKMANTLPTCPIVAKWREGVGDFGDHGMTLVLEDGEARTVCKTMPFGFVAPDAKVWFQKFNDTDAFGNETEREYLMTEGYLWTGQFPEVRKAVDEGQPQSMELDNETLDGDWATDPSTGLDFFIINDAVFSKLCILGDDVEPCFEGASITAVPTEYTATDDDNVEFNRTLFSMMQELKEIVSKPAEGGLNMPNEDKQEDILNEEPIDSTESLGEDVAGEAEVVETAVEPEPAHPADPEPEFSMTALVEEVESLREQNASLQSELTALKEFKLKVENDEKDALIAKYFMLTDEDKADVVEHKAEYTLGEIEAKLALAYVKKNVNFNLDEDEEAEKDAPTIQFSLDDNNEDPSDSAFENPLIMALRDYRRENSIY